MKKILVTISLFMVAVATQAADIKNVSGTVSKVQLMGMNYTSYNTSGNAIAFIYMEALPDSCGNPNGFKRVAITSDHPAYNAVISGALAAKASDQTVKMHYIEDCTLWNNNAWDFAIMTVK